MARRSIILNELSNRITIYEGDVKTASDQFGKNCYDAVTVNPPYMNQGHGLKNPNMPMAIARHEILCTLEDVIRESANLLKPKGRFYMVHRPFRLAEIFAIMNSYRLRTKTNAAGVPFCGQGTKHGAYQRRERWKSDVKDHAAFDRISALNEHIPTSCLHYMA